MVSALQVGLSSRRASRKARSPPALNARPAPVSTIARSSLGGRLRRSATTASISSPIVTVIALRLSGWLSVTTVTVASASSRATRTSR